MLLDETLYPAIFKRKTTREYTAAPLEEARLKEVQGYIKTLVPLFPQEIFKLDVQLHKDKTCRLMAFAQNTMQGNANIGFMLQQLDLFLSTKNIGSRWLGMGKKPEDLAKEYAPLAYAICLQFGNAQGSVHRGSTEEFRRKKISEITNSTGTQLAAAIVPAGLAPSAVNSQPWYFCQNAGNINVYCKQQGFIQNKLYGRMNMFDMGIALCHLQLALQHAGLRHSITVQTSPALKEGYKYFVTFQLAN